MKDHRFAGRMSPEDAVYEVSGVARPMGRTAMDEWGATDDDFDTQSILAAARQSIDNATGIPGPELMAEAGARAFAIAGRLTSKDTNPKDAIGTRKWRRMTTVPLTVIAELGVAMLEGAMKYGRHNFRVAGVRASVYVDAAVWHIGQWWEGEDTDPDSGLSHITKAIASLTVLRDAMIQDKLADDRPPKANLDRVRGELQRVVDELFEKYPEPKAPYTEKEPTDAER